jgi:hypothetical protein
MGQRQIMAQGAGIGTAVRDLSQEMGTTQQDVQGLIQQMGQQRMFQTTRSVREFKEKFREVLSAVKEVAQATSSTLDETMQTFGELRQQGFYTTADIKAAAAKQQSREMSTGIARGQLAAIGQVGAQQARARGMRGRYGAEMFQRSVAGVSMGLRSGAISEEAVEEMGGVEAAGMRLAQQQMRFLGTSRGRAMIAYTMGQGGRPDLSRMAGVMGGGMTVESLVTGAAGRGLGTLRAAGTAQAREQYAPYAGMMMVQMAAAQQRQLYGGVSERGILGMLGTMGVNRREGRMMVQQAMGLPEQMRREAEAQELAQSQAGFQQLRERGRSQGVRGALRRGIGLPLQEFGAQETQRFQRIARGFQREFTNYQEFQLGGEEGLARGFYRGGGWGGGRSPGGAYGFEQTRTDRDWYDPAARSRAGRAIGRWGYTDEYNIGTVAGLVETGLERLGGDWFGPPMGQERLRESIPQSMQLHGGTVKEMIKSGTVRPEDFVFLGRDRAVRKTDLDTYSKASNAQTMKLSDDQRAALDKEIMQGTLRKKVAGLMGDEEVEELTGFKLGGMKEAGKAEARAFAIGKTAGIIPEDVGFKDYVSGRAGFDKTERIRIQKMLADYMSKQEDERDRALLPPSEGGLRGLANIEEERKKSREGMKNFFRVAAPGWGGTISGEGKGLMERLDSDSEARQAFSNFMDVYAREDATDQEKVAMLGAALDVLGEESEEGKALKNMAERMDEGGWEGQAISSNWRSKGGGRDVLQRRAAAEVSNAQMSRLQQNIGKNLSKMPGMTTVSPEMKRRMTELYQGVTTKRPFRTRYLVKKRSAF